MVVHCGLLTMLGYANTIVAANDFFRLNMPTRYQWYLTLKFKFCPSPMEWRSICCWDLENPCHDFNLARTGYLRRGSRWVLLYRWPWFQEPRSRYCFTIWGSHLSWIASAYDLSLSNLPKPLCSFLRFGTIWRFEFAISKIWILLVHSLFGAKSQCLFHHHVFDPVQNSHRVTGCSTKTKAVVNRTKAKSHMLQKQWSYAGKLQ